MPCVSIILPIYNVEQYLRECLDSVVNQTLKDIEIICVNDGSTDNSLAIMQEYAEKDSRIKIISKPNSGYGHTMNVGIDAATGKYIGIVEPDDYVQLDMYETLYNLAEKNQVDLIKADFYRFKGSGRDLKLEYNQLSKEKNYYGKVLNPKDNLEVFRFIMNTWSGIYNREFLNRYHIRHNETPGASFQDNGFWFQTFCWAERMYFVNQPFYMNRRDNPNSSVHDPNKVYCMSGEYKFIRRFLDSQPQFMEKYKYMYMYKKYHNFMFSYNRIGQEHKLAYLLNMSKEFSEDMRENLIDRKLFTQSALATMDSIICNPEKYYFAHEGGQYNLTIQNDELNQVKKELMVLKAQYNDLKESNSYKIGRVVTFIPREVYHVYQCYKDNGVKYTIDKIVDTLLGKKK